MRIAVTGAAGQVGYALLTRLASGEVFGPQTPVTLQLLELESALPALDGVIMELEDCAFPTLAGVAATADPKVAFDGASWALMLAAIPRRAGQERGDLLAVNAKIFKPLGEALNARAASDVRAQPPEELTAKHKQKRGKSKDQSETGTGEEEKTDSEMEE